MDEWVCGWTDIQDRWADKCIAIQVDCVQWGLSFTDTPNSSLLWFPNVHSSCQTTGAVITAFTFLGF